MINKIVIDKKGIKKTIKVNANDIFYLKNIRGERWKDIEGYSGLYKISNYGRIKTFYNKKRNNNNDNEDEKIQILKVRTNNFNKYLTVYLFSRETKKTKRYLVQILVAKSFIPNKENKKYVVHENKIRSDNRATNLYWSDGSMRGRFGKDNHRSKKILQYDLNGKLIKEWDSITQINKELGFSIQNIRLVCIGKQKKSNNFIWKFKNKK